MRRLGLLALLLACAPLGAMERCVWRDEFNGEQLDTRYWTPELNFVRNVNAVQIYTDRPKNLYVKSGTIRFASWFETFANTAWKPQSPRWFENRKQADYTSGSINSRGKVAFRYGRVEIRARIDHGRGVWPALWLIGNNPGGWPACGEIDILEYVSQNPRTVHATFHYMQNGQYRHPTRPHDAGQPLHGKWHLYGMNWTPEKIELTFDRKVIHTLPLDSTVGEDGTTPFRNGTFHFILNQAIGGDWAERPNPKDYPRTFAVDYIRLYQDPAVPGTLLELPKSDPAAGARNDRPGPDNGAPRPTFSKRPASTPKRVSPKKR